MSYEKVIIYYNFLVPVEVVFNAWTNEDLLRKWLFVGPTSELTVILLDLRQGGKFSFLELNKDTGKSIEHFGNFLIIDRPHRLSFTHFVRAHFEDVANIDITIISNHEGATLELIQTGVAKEVTEQRWREGLAQLKLTLENQ